MRGVLAACFALVVAAFVAYVVRAPLRDQAAPGRCDRIASMVPSLTESLYAIGCGERVVGVTDYCVFPIEARSKPRLGGYLDPNYEAIVAARPDLVLTMPEQGDLRKNLSALGVKTLTVPQLDIDGILGSLTTLGDLCGAPEEAARVRRAVEERLKRIAAAVQGRPRPRTLVCVGRSVSSTRLEDVYVAGARGFLHEIVVRAGGANACPDSATAYPALSPEGLIVLDPEVIIDMLPDLAARGLSFEVALAAWETLPMVAAVKARRIYAITEDFAVIPGPRFILTLERVARLLHPDAVWGEP
jgi:iron complex transport system substrate-binding protein